MSKNNKKGAQCAPYPLTGEAFRRMLFTHQLIHGIGGQCPPYTSMLAFGAGQGVPGRLAFGEGILFPGQDGFQGFQGHFHLGVVGL